MELLGTSGYSLTNFADHETISTMIIREVCDYCRLGHLKSEHLYRIAGLPFGSVDWISGYERCLD